ncbi:AraC family transcriptional regulator [Xenorhabdus lircayensis]|uniref:AraC family transcriptional regulator n=1 Tax=Xenorhabdus lircayensis TaxID=2763499 RepID=A0ABS0U830_9GAMM|nr:GyrI-like domain-containing protein [Xenorhabdus lircayensis]MBI6549669.1 AraC family transcriptional regulator [Xenorhabdus lircayensis]
MTMIKRRLNALLHYIDENIDTNMNGESLSSIAACSKYHFHRLFSANYGIGVAAYIRQLRLKKAVYDLAYSHSSIIDIALTCGYESPEAFSRAFKSAVGQSPMEFRKKPDWSIWYSRHQIINDIRTKVMNERLPLVEVKIVSFPETSVAVMEHKGSPSDIGNTVREFKEWRIGNKLPPERYRTFNLVYADPEKVEPDEYQFDLCVEITSTFEVNHPKIIQKTLPSGKCAYIRHIGSDGEIPVIVNYLYTRWLSENNQEIRDFPLFFERIKLFPTVPEAEAVTDIYLPLI